MTCCKCRPAGKFAPPVKAEAVRLLGLRPKSANAGDVLWVEVADALVERWREMIEENPLASYYEPGVMGTALDDLPYPRNPGWLSPNGLGCGYLWDSELTNYDRLLMVEAQRLGTHDAEQKADRYSEREFRSIGPYEPTRTLHLLISRHMIVLAHRLVERHREENKR